MSSAVLLDFIRAARGAGVRVSPAESIDAVQVVDALGWDDRTTLRDGLLLVLAKTEEEKGKVRECFDLFFARPELKPAEPPPMPEPEAESEGQPGEGAGGQPQGTGGGALAQMLRQADMAGLQARLEQAAEAVGVRNISVFTQVNLYARRILERMGLNELDREINRGGPGAQQLRQGRDWLRGEARALVERNLQLFARGETEKFREEMLRRSRLSSLRREDVQRMRALVRGMARRLAARYARPRRVARRGVLDTRRTIRRNMAWDGIPFRTIWKTRKIEKPQLVVICDVSGSVATVAQFLLLFLWSLNEALSGLRAFAFSNRMMEVTEILNRLPIEQAGAEVLAQVGFGSTAYGASLEDFCRMALAKLNRETTVLILGDARGNRTDPRVDLLRDIADRSKQVIWLNPEHPLAWGTGDSDMLRYRPYCRVATQCATLDQLERVIEDLLKAER